VTLLGFGINFDVWMASIAPTDIAVGRSMRGTLWCRGVKVTCLAEIIPFSDKDSCNANIKIIFWQLSTFLILLLLKEADDTHSIHLCCYYTDLFSKYGDLITPYVTMSKLGNHVARGTFLLDLVLIPDGKAVGSR